MNKMHEVSDSQREYIHICGDSCVGKKVLRGKIEDDEPGIRERFGISGTFSFHGPIHDRRDATLNVLLECMLAAREDHVIHHWQVCSHPIIQKTMDAKPHSRHRIFLLWRPWKVHRRSLIERRKLNRPGTEAETRTVRSLMGGLEAAGLTAIPGLFLHDYRCLDTRIRRN